MDHEVCKCNIEDANLNHEINQFTERKKTFLSLSAWLYAFSSLSKLSIVFCIT